MSRFDSTELEFLKTERKEELKLFALQVLQKIGRPTFRCSYVELIIKEARIRYGLKGSEAREIGEVAAELGLREMGWN